MRETGKPPRPRFIPVARNILKPFQTTDLLPERSANPSLNRDMRSRISVSVKLGNLPKKSRGRFKISIRLGSQSALAQQSPQHHRRKIHLPPAIELPHDHRLNQFRLHRKPGENSFDHDRVLELEQRRRRGQSRFKINNRRCIADDIRRPGGPDGSGRTASAALGGKPSQIWFSFAHVIPHRGPHASPLALQVA